MQNKNLIPIIAIALAFLLICAALTCLFISVGYEFDLYNKLFGDKEITTETAQAKPTVQYYFSENFTCFQV